MTITHSPAHPGTPGFDPTKWYMPAHVAYDHVLTDELVVETGGRIGLDTAHEVVFFWPDMLNPGSVIPAGYEKTVHSILLDVPKRPVLSLQVQNFGLSQARIQIQVPCGIKVTLPFPFKMLGGSGISFRLLSREEAPFRARLELHGPYGRCRV